MYYKLLLKPIVGSNQQVTENMIIETLQKSFNKAFSTFPYIFENINSKESIENYNSGDCVSLSLFMKNYLKKKYQINSFIIPATIPNKYKYNGYLEISHVALVIPINNNKFFIADPAFYFLNPIILNKNNLSENKLVFSKNIYSYEPNKKLENYLTIDKIISVTKKTKEMITYNDYQSIPKNTYYSECNYDDDIYDTWKYFLIEVINPDEAISTFFINIRKKNPFITTCLMDQNGVCKQRFYISFKNKSIKIQEFAKDTIIVDINEMSLELINSLEKKLYKYFKGNFRKYLTIYYNDILNNIDYKFTLQDVY